MVDHELAHILPGYPGKLRHIRQPDKIGSRFNELCRGDASLDIRERTQECRLRIFGFTGEFQRNTARLPDTHRMRPANAY